LNRQEQIWTDLVTEFRRDREALLRNHERVWCQSMGHLLQQFQVANSNGIMMALEEWMASSVPEFLDKSPINVHLSKVDYEKIRGSQQELRGPHWTMQADSELRPGQLRIEAGNAGVIFDSIRSFEKLSKLLESDS